MWAWIITVVLLGGAWILWRLSAESTALRCAHLRPPLFPWGRWGCEEWDKYEIVERNDPAYCGERYCCFWVIDPEALGKDPQP